VSPSAYATLFVGDAIDDFGQGSISQTWTRSPIPTVKSKQEKTLLEPNFESKRHRYMQV